MLAIVDLHDTQEAEDVSMAMLSFQEEYFIKSSVCREDQGNGDDPSSSTSLQVVLSRTLPPSWSSMILME